MKDGSECTGRQLSPHTFFFLRALYATSPTNTSTKAQEAAVHKKNYTSSAKSRNIKLEHKYKQINNFELNCPRKV